MKDNSTFYKNKNILVTGGTGFIGNNLVKRLLLEEANILIPIHDRKLHFTHNNIETIEADLTRLTDCLRVCQDIDYVFHAAGAVGSAALLKRSPMMGIPENLVLTVNIVQAAIETNIKQIELFSSSTGYPAFTHSVKEDEFWSGEPHPSYFGYGWMRRYIEKLAEFVTHSSNLHTTIIRPTAVYGIFDNFDPSTCHVIPALIHRALNQEDPFVVWGEGCEVRDFLYVEDFVDGCIDAFREITTFDPINIGYGQITTIKEVVDIVLSATGHKPKNLTFDSSKPASLPFRSVDTTKAKAMFGFSPKYSIEDGIIKTVNWYKDHIA